MLEWSWPAWLLSVAAVAASGMVAALEGHWNRGRGLDVGFGAHGMWGAFPSYLTERFPSEVRGAGAGFCYHAGALVGSFTSFAIGHLVDAGWTLSHAMTLSIALSGVAVSLLIWLGPETRGRRFQ